MYYIYISLHKGRRSSLIYNTSARHERHECETGATFATRLLHKRQECDTSEKFDFDNDTCKNIFSHPYIYYMASERLQGQEQFHTKNYLLEMSCFYAKMRLKSARQKLNFLMAKAISNSCTLDCSCKCPCTFSHSLAQ